jgi:hypothetical protein
MRILNYIDIKGAQQCRNPSTGRRRYFPAGRDVAADSFSFSL